MCNLFHTDIEMKDQTNCWSMELCPNDILLVIFKQLNAKDLLTCRFVNKTWRSIADYCGEHYNIWDKLLLEESMQNSVETYKQRTLLDSKSIYLNYHMWYSTHEQQVDLKHVYDLKDVRNIHVYKDSLITICTDSVKYFNLEKGTIIKEIPGTYLDYQETEFLVTKCRQNGSTKNFSIYSKTHDETRKCVGYGIYNVLQNKCYLKDMKLRLVYYESTPKTFTKKYLGRSYNGPTNLWYISIAADEVYIFKWTGDVFRRKHGDLNVKKICKLDVPHPSASIDPFPIAVFMTMFDKCSVVYGVQKKEMEGLKKNVDIYGEEHLILLYLDLTCAKQHGNILLLGFNNGKVGIVIIKKVWETNDLTPAFQFYIQEVAPIDDVEPIESLEVHEAEECHHVIVMTKSKLYQFVISQSDYNKVMP